MVRPIWLAVSSKYFRELTPQSLFRYRMPTLDAPKYSFTPVFAIQGASLSCRPAMENAYSLMGAKSAAEAVGERRVIFASSAMGAAAIEQPEENSPRIARMLSSSARLLAMSAVVCWSLSESLKISSSSRPLMPPAALISRTAMFVAT